jgi:starch synthase/alpha-amylase
VDQNTGNGFLFDIFDAQGLYWAIEQAMAFFDSPRAFKITQIERIMKQSMAQFTHAETARQYIALYEQMLQRPLIVDQQSNDVTR